MSIQRPKYSLMCAALLLLMPCGCSERQSPPPVSSSAVPPPIVWFSNWISQTYGKFSCCSFTQIPVTSVTDQVFFPDILLKRFAARSFFSAVFTNQNPYSSGPLLFYGAEFPSALHAYGIYSSSPSGIDQSAVRGGPSKRVGMTMVALKDSRVVWTGPVLNGTSPALYDYELPFTALCNALPGSQWILPPEVASLSIISPAPDCIEFTPENYMGLPFFNGALRARFYSTDGSVELFSLIPSPGETGYDQLRDFRDWLKLQGITAMVVLVDHEERLFVNQPGLDPLYLVARTNQLCGVKGMKSITDAQGLLARWQR